MLASPVPSPTVVQTRIDRRKQTEGRPVKAVRPASCHPDEAIVDEARSRHGHGCAFGFGQRDAAGP
jgi:hypothetical protein